MSRDKRLKDKPNNHVNCVTEEYERLPVSAKKSVKERNAYEKGKTFERVPIFRGYILKEVK